MGADALEDAGGGGEAHVAGPRQAFFGEHDGERGRGAFGDFDELAGVAHPVEQGALVGDGGRQADPAQAGDEGAEAGETEGELVAAFGAGEGVNLVDDDGAQAGEKGGSVGLGEEEGEALGGGEEDVGRVGFQAGAAVLGGVAGAGLDGDGELHLVYRGEQVAGDVGGEGLEGGDVEGVQAEGGGLGEFDQAGQEAGERLAAAGGGDEEGAVAGAGGVDHRELVGARRPAAVGEPGGEWFG